MTKQVKVILGVIVVLLVVWGVVVSKKREQVEKEPIRVGILLPLTGTAAYYGESSKKGIELALEEVKAEHQNIDTSFYYEDNQFNPKVGVDAYTKLKLEHSIDVVISQTSPVAVAIQPLVKQDGILQMAISASADTYRTPDDLSFRTTGGTALEVEPMANFIVHQYPKVGLLFMQNEIGVSITNTLRDKIKSNGVMIPVDEGFAVDATDFRSALLKLKQQDVSAVYLAGLTSHIATFLKQAEELGVNVQVLSFRTAEDPTLIKNADMLADGVIFTSNFDSKNNNSETQAFVKSYMQRYQHEPDNYAAEAYLGTHLVLNSFLKCGKDYACIYSYLTGIKNTPSIFGNISFDANGDVFYPFFLKTVRNGEFVRFES